MMSDYYQDALQKHGSDYRTLLSEIENSVNDEYSPENEATMYPQTIFARHMLDELVDASLLPVVNDNRTDEYVAEHLLDTRIGRSDVNIYGSAMYRLPEGGYDVHLFACDYEHRDDVDVYTRAEFTKRFNALVNFYKASVAGKLDKVLNPGHPARAAAAALYEHREAIASVRCWIFTNRLYERPDSTGLVDANGLKIALQLVDLEFLRGIRNESVRINLNFRDTDIGGVPCIVCADDPDYACILTAIPGNILAKLYGKYGTALVQSNVRAYLGNNTVNKGVKETIRTEPARFLAYNNGLVLSVSSAVIDEKTSTVLYELSDIQIINGGQTTANIYQTWVSAGRNRSGKSREQAELVEANIAKLLVPVKVIVLSDKMSSADRANLRERISAAANSQTAVKTSDLSSNSAFQIAFANVVNNMPAPDGAFWYYQRARSLYKAEIEKLTGDRIGMAAFKKKYPKEKLLEKTDLAMAILAWEGDWVNCAKGKEHAFSEFAKRFNSESDVTIDPAEAKTMISKWILFKRLESEARKRLKKQGLANPRVPVIYTIGLFAKAYDTSVHWDRIWSRQDISPAFLEALLAMTDRVTALISNAMGQEMIAMWGRKKCCGESLEASFTFDGLDFSNVYELGD